LIADEPTLGLAPLVRLQVVRALAEPERYECCHTPG
jgi:ABC-type branched-subunit amino acid transport system ATPase component